MLPQEIIDNICMHMPLEKAWYISRYTAKRLYDPLTHNANYWTKLTGINILKYFLEYNKISLENKDNLCGRACCRGRIDILQLLLKYGMSISNSNFSICWASCNNQIDTVKFLSNLGCKIKSKYDGCHTFVFIVKNGNYIAIKFLLENNYYDIKNEDESLICVDGPERMRVIKLLLDHGCDLSLGNNRYAISVACMMNDINLVKLLLEYGADPTFSNNSALEYAKSNNNIDIVQLLLDHGCKL